MSTTNILDLNNRIDALEKNGGGGSADSAKRSDIASEFSATTAYTAGCFVYYDGKLYQFNADHAAGAWDPTDVVEAKVTDQVVSNASAIAGLTASDVAYDNTTSGLTATDVQGAMDELADSYPAAKVMLSDGVTSVEDALDALEIKFAEKSGTTDSAGLLTVDNIPTNSIMLQIIAASTNVHCFGTRLTDDGTSCRIGIHRQTTGEALGNTAVTVYVYYIEVASS